MRLIPICTVLFLLAPSLTAFAQQPDSVCYVDLASGEWIDLSSICGSGKNGSIYNSPRNSSLSLGSKRSIARVEQSDVDEAYIEAMIKRVKGNGTIGDYPAVLIKANPEVIIDSAYNFCGYRRRGMLSMGATDASRKDFRNMLVNPNDYRKLSAINFILKAQQYLAPQYYCPDMKTK